MASIQKEHYFYEGKKSKKSGAGPGILVVEGKYRFRLNKVDCRMWKQQFVWMLKYNTHWIPVVWGWLPDKSEVSYKVGY